MRRKIVVPKMLLSCLCVLSLLLMSVMQVQAVPVIHPAKDQTKRRSVIDYFYLLSWVGVGGATQSDKRELLQSQHHPIIDLRHDYLLVYPDSSPAEQVAIFRSRGKADLVAMSMPDFETDYNAFVLYRLQNGRLKDVTRSLLPVPARTEHFLYELPRTGTTIRVFRFNFETQSRHHVFDLQWRHGQFVKVN